MRGFANFFHHLTPVITAAGLLNCLASAQRLAFSQASWDSQPAIGIIYHHRHRHQHRHYHQHHHHVKHKHYNDCQTFPCSPHYHDTKQMEEQHVPKLSQIRHSLFPLHIYPTSRTSGGQRPGVPWPSFHLYTRQRELGQDLASLHHMFRDRITIFFPFRIGAVLDKYMSRFHFDSTSY